MRKPLAIILTGYGINCDYETEHAFLAAGADTRRLHFNELTQNKDILRNAHIFAIPGGFSFADDIASGKILANKLKFKLMDVLTEFINRGRLIIGICNGFQVLIRLGLLPGYPMMAQHASLSINDSSIFEDRWVYLKTREKNPCVFLNGIKRMFLPVRHMEGKLVIKDKNILEKVKNNRSDCLIYTSPSGDKAHYPYNPNGSLCDIAGLCDRTGRIFGLMPHPEAYNHPSNNPYYMSLCNQDFPSGLEIMKNAVIYFQ
jgi:phosphoribosylformylglycinamidine synthase